MNPSHSEVLSDCVVGTPIWRSGKLHRWVSVGALYLSAISLVALAVTNWRAIDAATARTEVINTQQREFNRNLVVAIENLAEKTGILTSADFCPVRFRMRHRDGTIPGRPVNGMLDRRQPDGELHQCGARITIAGVMEFGLQPPGRYRLTLETQDRMVLKHEFDVLPGAPVDRVVICPNAAPPDQVPTDAEIVVEWPPELAAAHVVGLVEFEPGPFESEEWHWKCETDWPSHVVAAVGDPGSFPETERGLLFNGILWSDAQREIFPADAVPLPYRYCQVRAITFVRRIHNDQSREQMQIIGTYQYGSDAGKESDAVRFWDAQTAPPVYEAVPGHSNTWSLEIPEDCVDELLRRIQETEHSRELAT